MRRVASMCAALAAAAALIATARATAAVEPELISSKLFDVVVSPGPVLEISFVLTLSDVSTYPVTITAIGGSIEEQLWDGTLSEGSYRLRAPLTKIKSGPVRVVLRTKMTNLQERRRLTEEEKKKAEKEGKTPKEAEGGNQSFYSYRRWEGTIGAR